MITDICEKTMTPDQLRGFYKLDAKGFKQFITQQEIAEKMNLPDSRVYRSYLFDKSKVSYRQPSPAILRLSWFVAQELLAEGWKI